MKEKDKRPGFVVWVLELILSNALMFCLNRGLTPTFWITFGFAWLAFLSYLILQVLIRKRAVDSDERFLNIPTQIISYVYIIIQIFLCVIFAIGSGTIPWKATLLINIILVVLVCIAIIASLIGNDYVQKVNGRQKNHHRRL